MNGSKGRTPTTPPARILIVDRHTIMRLGMCQIVSHEPDLEVCGEAMNAEEALRLTDATPADLIVIEVSSADPEGLSLITELRSRHPATRILAASMEHAAPLVDHALEAGAMGFIHKAEAIDELVEGIRRVLDGHRYLSGETSEKLSRYRGVGRGGRG